MSSGSPSIGRGRWRVFAGAWIALSLLAAAWAISSPISSGPDEPAHIIKAASVVRGEFVGPQGTYGNEVDVPNYVSWTNAQTCFVFQPTVPANCAPAVEGDPGKIVPGSTTAGYNNPAYYALVGWPTLIFSDSTGIYAMRIVSGILSSGMLALAFMLVSTWRRPTIPTVGLLAAITPMVLYVNGLVNPSSFEISGIITAFVAMMTIVSQPNERMLREQAIVLVSVSVLAANTRTISPLWVALAIVLPLLLLRGRELGVLLRKRVVLVSAAVVALGAALAIAWTPISTRLATDAAAGAPATPVITTLFPDVGQSPFFGFVKMVTLTFTNGADMIGNFGWLDTPVPATTIVIWTMLLGVILLAGFVLLRGRRAFVGATLLLLALILPALIQAAFITTGGFIWQGRYGLPIFAMLIFGVAALVGTSLENSRFSATALSRLIFAVIVGFIAGQGYGFLKAMRRNVIGSDTSWKQLITDPQWIPPGGVALSLALFVVGLLILAVVVFRLRSTERRIEVVGSDA
ncbi:hypothetical protein ASF79_03460 [Agreia sp. Leaf335]|uniref:DUF2142 domain-containing protein n=1 Tax=Agreia sp. Leaf335 TaxID=1736340 RepID=UPI0006FDCC80|nr:DUF2142 domain-containing protein [Agreia sp. Leaf335]KQR24274.1 hypothetical protein ASF79_03460 [Agreia sp. Leaf335]